MPRAGQIIPEYIHPHEEVYINDNTQYEDTTSSNAGPTFLCVFTSGKGRDKLLFKNSFSEWLKEYGKPNYQKYGQAGYMPYVMLGTGYAQTWNLRLTATDSTYSNLILVVGYKQENAKLKLKFITYTRTNLRSIADLESFANTLETTTPDEDGYKYLPIMTFWSLGRGVYGDDYRIRITHDKNADKENDYKNYKVEILSTEEGAKMIESYNVTFYAEGVDPNTKLTNYVEDIVNEEDGDGSSRIACQFFYDNYVKLFEEYTKVYNNNGYIAPTVELVDRLPAITLPSTSILYHLTQTDGAKAPGTYVYDADTGVFVQSNFVVSEVTTLPATLVANTVYKLTQDFEIDDLDEGTTTTYPKGSTWIKGETAGSYTEGPDVLDVEKLPSTQLYADGVVYELTADDGNKGEGSQWIYNSTADDFVAYVEEGPDEPDPMEYDISTWDMFGYNRFTKSDDEFIVFDGGKEKITIMDIEGVNLSSGSDGSFGENVDKATREAAIEEAYIEAFQGGTDKKIKSTRRAPVELILDAAHSVEIKKAMVSLALQRMDAMVKLDSGLLQSVNDLYDLGIALSSINTFMATKDTGMMKILDPITGKQIPASITLWMAQAIPLHYYNYGNHQAMAGERFATLSGYVKNSIRPEIDADDLEIKEKLCVDYQMNYIEALDEDTYIRGNQITSQQFTSDLSEENNVLVLLEIKRKIERLAGRRRFMFSEAEDLRKFQESCDTIFSSYRGTKCRSIEIRVEMTKWEETRYIVHVYLEVVFRTFQKRAIIEIDVNPRA